MTVKGTVVRVATYYSMHTCRDPLHQARVGKVVYRSYPYWLEVRLECGASFQVHKAACSKCLPAKGDVVEHQLEELRHWHDGPDVFWPWSLSIDALQQHVLARVMAKSPMSPWDFGQPITVAVPEMVVRLEPCAAAVKEG